MRWKQLLSLSAICFCVMPMALQGANAVKAEAVGAFHTTKDDRLILMRVYTEPAAPETVWLESDALWKSTELIVPAAPEAKVEIPYRIGDNTGMLTVTAPKTHARFFTLDQGINLFAPFLVRRGDPADIFAECWSRWELPMRFIWTRTVSTPLPGVVDQRELLLLDPRKSDREMRFTPGEFHREKIIFNSAALPDANWECIFTLALPGMDFLQRKVRFIPVHELPVLSVAPNGQLVDEAGNLVVPVLAERTLAAQRTWELPRRLWNDNLPVHSATVIGCNFGTGEHTLAGQLRRKRTGLQFLPWNSAAAGIAEVAEAVNILGCQPTQAVTILVPPRSIRLGGDREWLNYLALLDEVARSSATVRKVTLALLPAEPNMPESEEFLSGVRRLGRNSDTVILELDLLWNPPNREECFREMPGEESWRNALPVQAVDELADILNRKAF